MLYQKKCTDNIFQCRTPAGRDCKSVGHDVRTAFHADLGPFAPRRPYSPKSGLSKVTPYVVPTSLELKDRRERDVELYRVVGWC